MRKKPIKEENYFDKMETAFGVNHKHENMTDEEKKQFGDMEEVEMEKPKEFKSGEPHANSGLKKVQKDAGKEAIDYYKSIIDKMAKNQKSNVGNPNVTRIGESKYDNALTRLDEDNLGTLVGGGIGLAVAAIHAFTIAPEYVEIFKDAYGEKKEVRVGDVYKGKIIDITEHGKRFTNPYTGEEGGSPQKGFRVEVLTDEGDTIVFYEMTLDRSSLPQDGTTVSITIIDHPDTEYLSPEMFSGQKYDVEMRENKKYDNALTRLEEGFRDSVENFYDTSRDYLEDLKLILRLAVKIGYNWGNFKKRPKVVQRHLRSWVDKELSNQPNYKFKRELEKLKGKLQDLEDLTFEKYYENPKNFSKHQEDMLVDRLKITDDGIERKKLGESYTIKVSDLLSEISSTSTVKLRNGDDEEGTIEEEFVVPKVNIEDDERKMYYGTGMEGLRYDTDGTERQETLDKRMEELNDDEDNSTYDRLKKDGQKYKDYKYGKEKYKRSEDEYQETPRVRVTKGVKTENTMVYKDVTKENTFKAKGKLVSEGQVLKLANKVPKRVKIDETVFAITDGENSYRLIWEGDEPIITHSKNKKMVSESIKEMKRLYNFNTNDNISTKKTITESGEDSFKRMFNQIRNSDGIVDKKNNN